MVGIDSDQISDNIISAWSKALVPMTSSLGEVIINLDQTSLQIALVVSPEGTLVGTLTDGDIRRGLLGGLGLDSPIETIIQKAPLVVPPKMGREMVLKIMQANKIHQLPVVDAARRVIGLHLWDDLLAPGPRPNLVVIMAGGQGKRLRPHTEKCPKPMLQVGGKPILEHIIEHARREGFHHFVIAVHYLGNMIEDYFGDGARWQIKIEYLREESPLGTAGAISMLNPRPNTPFLVSNGDVLTDIRYGELLDYHSRHQSAATMAVRLHEWQHPFGVVRTKGVDITGFEEKPTARSHINAGIYVLEPVALDQLQAGERCDMPTLFSRLKDNESRTIVYPMHEPWLDLGRPDDLARARTSLI